MITCELYINNVLCDLPGDSDVVLVYQSPIFSGLDFIQSNRSYNIALPITPTNRLAVGFAERPDVDSDAPYIKLPAALYLGGVPIFSSGYAVVTDISDTINVTLTWGNVDNFQPLFDSSLRDLGPQLEEMGEGHIDWNENTTILEASATGVYPGVAFWGVDYGMGLSKPKYLHPSVQVMTILSAIEKYNGITIDGKDRLAYSKNLGPIIPLVSKNGDEVSGKAETTKCGLSQATSNGQTILKGTDPTQHPEYVSGNYFDVKNARGVDVQITISGFLFSSNLEDLKGLKIYIAPSEDYNTVLADVGFDAMNEDDRIYIYGTPHVEIPQNKVPESGYVAIVVKHTKSVDLGGDISFYAYPRKNVNFPSVFPIAPNLPDMSQGDFILALMNMNGLFAYADKDSPNTIKLISIEDIVDNVDEGEIIDWSDRVILNEAQDVSRPESSTFTIDDLAQKNILDYDNDDEIQDETSGIITVNNVNIEKETELVELPFSASRNGVSLEGVNCAWIPIYEDDGKGGANYSECSPRILSVRGTFMSGIVRCIGVFDPWMRFGGEEGLVKTKYAAYQKVVDRLRIITTRAKLTALDLYNLDYTKPVYIAQFGKIFAIYSVETGEDGICECQLLKLEVAKEAPAGYYLRINGQRDLVEVSCDSKAQELTFLYDTNGTIQFNWPGGDGIRSIIASGGRITISLYANTMKIPWIRDIKFGITEDSSIQCRVVITQASPLQEGITSVNIGCLGFANQRKDIELAIPDLGLSGTARVTFNQASYVVIPPTTVLNAIGGTSPLSGYSGHILQAKMDNYSGSAEIPESGVFGMILIGKV